MAGRRLVFIKSEAPILKKVPILKNGFFGFFGELTQFSRLECHQGPLQHVRHFEEDTVDEQSREDEIDEMLRGSRDPPQDVPTANRYSLLNLRRTCPKLQCQRQNSLFEGEPRAGAQREAPRQQLTVPGAGVSTCRFCSGLAPRWISC